MELSFDTDQGRAMARKMIQSHDQIKQIVDEAKRMSEALTASNWQAAAAAQFNDTVTAWTASMQPTLNQLADARRRLDAEIVEWEQTAQIFEGEGGGAGPGAPPGPWPLEGPLSKGHLRTGVPGTSGNPGGNPADSANPAASQGGSNPGGGENAGSGGNGENKDKTGFNPEAKSKAEWKSGGQENDAQAQWTKKDGGRVGVPKESNSGDNTGNTGGGKPNSGQGSQSGDNAGNSGGGKPNGGQGGDSTGNSGGGKPNSGQGSQSGDSTSGKSNKRPGINGDVNLVNGSVFQQDAGPVKFKELGGEAGLKVGHGKNGWNLGVGGEAYGAKATAEGTLLGDQNLGLNAQGEAKVASAEANAGVIDNSLGAKAEVSLASIKGSAAAHTEYGDVGVHAGLSAGLGIGVSVGEHTEVKLGPFTVGLDVNPDIGAITKGTQDGAEWLGNKANDILPWNW